MPPLKNTRHEKFVQGLLEGKSAVDAHEHAGYVRDDGNASRLQANPKIQARLAELQTEIAKSTKVTVESLLAELESARQKATDLDQLSAAVRAIESKAKISGLLTQKVEVTAKHEADYSHCETITDVAEEMVDKFLQYEINPYHDFRDEDREYLIAVQIQLMEQASEATDRRLAEIKARPYRTSYNAPIGLLPQPNAKLTGHEET